MKKHANLYVFSSKVWIYPGNAAWHFVTVPRKESDQINAQFYKKKRGFGSLKLRATIGTTVWDTSIFPDSQSQCFLLPIKLAVRKKEKIAHEDVVRVSITIL